jgi:hypothetical protein
MQKTELESKIKRARNGSEQHRLRAADSPLQYGLGGRTVRKYGHRAAKKAQEKSRLPDCPLQYRGLSASENCLLSSIFRFAAKSSSTATKLGEHDHKAVGELPLKGHRPI